MDLCIYFHHPIAFRVLADLVSSIRSSRPSHLIWWALERAMPILGQTSSSCGVVSAVSVLPLHTSLSRRRRVFPWNRSTRCWKNRTHVHPRNGGLTRPLPLRQTLQRSVSVWRTPKGLQRATMSLLQRKMTSRFATRLRYSYLHVDYV